MPSRAAKIELLNKILAYCDSLTKEEKDKIIEKVCPLLEDEEINNSKYTKEASGE